MTHAEIFKRGSQMTIFVKKFGEDVFPFILAWRTVECRKHEHKHLGAHAERKQHVSARKVKYLEEGTPDYDSGTDTICKVEESLAVLTADKGTDDILVLLYFSLSHCN